MRVYWVIDIRRAVKFLVKKRAIHPFYFFDDAKKAAVHMAQMTNEIGREHCYIASDFEYDPVLLDDTSKVTPLFFKNLFSSIENIGVFSVTKEGIIKIIELKIKRDVNGKAINLTDTIGVVALKERIAKKNI